jgi:aryl-alcohol dehydrogenase-like predicted oxidoreductase
MLMDSIPENCRKTCGEALQKLGVDYIDIFYVHRLGDNTPVEKTIEALLELKK